MDWTGLSSPWPRLKGVLCCQCMDPGSQRLHEELIGLNMALTINREIFLEAEVVKTFDTENRDWGRERSAEERSSVKKLNLEH